MINTARLQAYQQKMYMEADAESTGELTGRAAYDDHRRAYLSQTAARLEREKQALQTFSPLLAASQGEAMTLDLLHVLPQELQVMSSISRRQLIELGIAVLIIRLAQLDGKRISAIDREESGWSLGKSVADGWKLFLEAGNPQMRSVLSMKNLTSPAGYKLPGKMHLWPVTMFGPFLT